MDIKILSREEWNSHPAVELVCQRHNDETPIYRLKAGWYYGDLSIPILEDGSVCAGLLKWLSSEKYNRFFGVLKGMELPRPDGTKIIEDHFIFYGSRVYYHFIYVSSASGWDFLTVECKTFLLSGKTSSYSGGSDIQ